MAADAVLGCEILSQMNEVGSGLKSYKLGYVQEQVLHTYSVDRDLGPY